MKFCCLPIIIFLLFPAKVFSEDDSSAAFYIKELPAGGVRLDKGWMFFPGDNAGYAKFNYDNKGGVPVDPTLVLGQLPVVQQAGIGWFRLKLRVDPTLQYKTIGMMISQFGASEIYLNEKLVYRLGKVSADYKEEKTQAIYAHAVTLKLGAGEDQLLAVRYSYNTKNMYRHGFTVPPCLRIVLRSANENTNRMALMAKHVYLLVGITLTIALAAAIITLFFYFSFPLRKEYLYFGLYFVCQFFGILVQSDLLAAGRHEWLAGNEMIVLILIANVFFIPGSILSLYGVNILFKSHGKRFSHFVQLYGIINLAAMLFLSEPVVALGLLFFPLTSIEVLCRSYRAARNNVRGAWIIFAAALLALLLLIVLIKAIMVNDLEFTMLMICITILVFAMSIVTFLASDFASTSVALRSRIAEVEDLSRKTVAQEREKQEILAAQKDKLELEVHERTAELSNSLAELKATQAQLIQSEKMASLGELTAGIAHEIQNPLNFVNNFSDVSNELIDEMTIEFLNGNANEALAIAEELKQNLEKINHHGRRADGIVKGMLQHSKTSSGIKEPTDINKLADEYLRLAYHGMRAKDKNFNADIKTDFDEAIEKINVVPQDIGRVLLNLFNNAFYAVSEKAKLSVIGFQQKAEGSERKANYKPFVSVQTKKINDKVGIIIIDNGDGIPQNIIDKIFQPFFTTKPTGQGTGLGLSLAYDIIKAHGGEIKVQTKVDEGNPDKFGKGEGSTFIIVLPV